MKVLEKLRYCLSGGKKIYFLLILLPLLIATSAHDASGTATQKINTADSSVSREIQTELHALKGQNFLKFPIAVTRFYEQHGFQPVWVKQQANPKQTWEAMLMLDCVIQFGLSHDDYHPDELSYDRLHIILEQPGKVNSDEKARFDITLTDAIIAFINHLHFGKLNPEFTAEIIDTGDTGGFCAEDILAIALQQNNLMAAIVNTQPQTKDYANLQYHMHLLEGVYQGDCYAVPEATVRKMAVNMERMRWASTGKASWLQVNIPSYTLRFHRQDTTYEFKAAVGKPVHQTPVLESKLTYFTTAPERKVVTAFQKSDNSNVAGFNSPAGSGGYGPNANALCTIYFWFDNKTGISIKGLTRNPLFKKPARDITNGEIIVEGSEKLAKLLLEYDGQTNKSTALHAAITDFRVQNFMLDNPLPLKITYYTCEMKNGTLVSYDDIYQLDQQLEMALYNVRGPQAIKP